MFIEWAIRYMDSVFTNIDGVPHEAPRENVQRVYYMDSRGDICVEVSPVGLWGWKTDAQDNNGQWFGFDEHGGFHRYELTYPRPIIPLFGCTLHGHEWESMISEDILKVMGVSKTAWRKRERDARRP
jgi:hypothetical protein